MNLSKIQFILNLLLAIASAQSCADGPAGESRKNELNGKKTVDGTDSSANVRGSGSNRKDFDDSDDADRKSDETSSNPEKVTPVISAEMLPTSSLQSAPTISSMTNNANKYLLTISLSFTNPDLSIAYTVDNTQPRCGLSTEYSQAFQVYASQIVNAVACDGPTAVGEIATRIFTSDLALTAPVFNKASGEYALGQTLAIDAPIVNAKIYFTTDGSEPTNKSTVYSAPITIDSSMTIKAFAELPPL